MHRYLDQHPDVYMSPVKEPNYFAPHTWAVDPLWPNRLEAVTTLEEYRGLFAAVASQIAIGEASTVYLAGEQSPVLIREAVPDARLIVMLRNPADRVFSDYCLHRSWNFEELSFADAVNAELDAEPVAGRMRGYVLAGFYGRYLTRYLECFDRSQLRAYLYDDLVADPATLLRDVFEFLSVDVEFSPTTTERHNASKFEPRSRLIARIARSQRYGASRARGVAARLGPHPRVRPARERGDPGVPRRDPTAAARGLPRRHRAHGTHHRSGSLGVVGREPRRSVRRRIAPGLFRRRSILVGAEHRVVDERWRDAARGARQSASRGGWFEPVDFQTVVLATATELGACGELFIGSREEQRRLLVGSRPRPSGRPTLK